MIDYNAGSWSVGLVFKVSGSVIQKGLPWAIPSALLAFALTRFYPDVLDVSGLQGIWSGYTTVLGFLVVFRNNQAYARFWDGAALVQQIRGEWINATSSLIAFCDHEESKRREVAAFQHLLVRLMSMLHCAALQQIADVEDDCFEIIMPHGIEGHALRILSNHPKDRCEILLQWVQRLIVEHHEAGTLKISPPILSRVFQELSLGIVNLHDVRRIKEIPFPFPYAQLITVMMITHTIATPILASQAAVSPGWAASITICVVTAFWSLFYIALELEQPFGEDKNDLPVAEMQQEMNRTLALLLKRDVQVPPKFEYDETCHAVIEFRRSTTAVMQPFAPLGSFLDLSSPRFSVAGSREHSPVDLNDQHGQSSTDDWAAAAEEDLEPKIRSPRMSDPPITPRMDPFPSHTHSQSLPPPMPDDGGDQGNLPLSPPHSQDTGERRSFDLEGASSPTRLLVRKATPPLQPKCQLPTSATRTFGSSRPVTLATTPSAQVSTAAFPAFPPYISEKSIGHFSSLRMMTPEAAIRSPSK